MQREKATLLQWLGLKSEIDYAKNTLLGGFIGASLILFVLILLLVSIAVLLMIVATVFEGGLLIADGQAEVIRNLGLLLAATVGLPFLVWRSIVAQKQVNVAEQGHITDRINEAVKGLGAEKVIKQIKKTPRYKKKNDEWLLEKGKPVPALRPDGEPIIDVENFEESVPNLEVRIGSIYALERIALDSPRDHIQIMEILCAYLRENAPAKSLNPWQPKITERPKVRTDIQAVINIIGRRTKKQIEIEWTNRYRLDFRNTDLSGGDFRYGDFSGAKFHSCRLEAAMFDRALLHGSQFFGSLLNYASFMNAELRGTRFDEITLNQPEPTPGGMVESINMGKILGISLIGANISAVDYLGEDVEMQRTFGTKDTTLSSELEEKRKCLSEHCKKLGQLRHGEKQVKIQSLTQKIQEHGFLNWCAFDQNDLTVGSQYKKFMSSLGLTGFPYFDD
ncbi:pentapeptide repeat-containing protein [Thalassospira lucentensis]|uniref:pentapeptide repeat-containing protein n=1 Tax=Thalassospira lucentensis TaxID=168935 RepID=UPI0023F29EAC|nr:pentapeptide repeat-containing protein [Thalassospira lucentensis]